MCCSIQREIPSVSVKTKVEPLVHARRGTADGQPDVEDVIRLPPPAPKDGRVIRLFAFAEEMLAVRDTQSVE